MAGQYFNQTGYGLSQAITQEASQPVRARRAPGARDTQYLAGQIWVDMAASEAYILVNSVAGVPTWNLLEGSGGTGIFTTLTSSGNTALATGAAATFAAGTAAGGAVTMDSGAGISLDAATASNFTVTGAADLTLSTTLGSLNLLGGEAAADAVRVNASNAAGGIDVDCGTAGIAIDSTGAFSIDGAAASNVTTTGAGIDLTLSSVLGSVLVSSTEDAALAIKLHANGGVSETIQLHSDLGTGVGSINLLSDVGGITLRATGLASADAINLEAPAGGLDVDVALQMNLTSSQAAADSIVIRSSDAAGGIDVDAGTGGVTVDSSGSISIDAANVSNFSVTGAFDVTVSSSLGSANIAAGEAVIDAIALTASNAAGGVQITTGTLAATTGINLVQGAQNASIQVGTGAPVHSAPKGSLYLNTAGSGIADRLYVATDAIGGWTNFVSAA